MPTLKKRINITLSPIADKMLRQISKRDKIPAATRAAELLEMALEIEEDAILTQIATTRMQQKNPTVSHTAAWN